MWKRSIGGAGPSFSYIWMSFTLGFSLVVIGRVGQGLVNQKDTVFSGCALRLPKGCTLWAQPETPVRRTAARPARLLLDLGAGRACPDPFTSL